MQLSSAGQITGRRSSVGKVAGGLRAQHKHQCISCLRCSHRQRPRRCFKQLGHQAVYTSTSIVLEHEYRPNTAIDQPCAKPNETKPRMSNKQLDDQPSTLIDQDFAAQTWVDHRGSTVWRVAKSKAPKVPLHEQQWPQSMVTDAMFNALQRPIPAPVTAYHNAGHTLATMECPVQATGVEVPSAEMELWPTIWWQYAASRK